MNDEIISPNQARYLRLRAQHLQSTARQSKGGVAQLVRDVCSLQAQDAFAAVLAVWARSRGLVADQVEQARVGERSIVRTWCMRGTLHLLASEDLGWLLPLFGPVFVRKSRRRYTQLGLTEDMGTRAVQAIGDILHDQGPLIRAELAALLSDRGIPTEGQAAYHLLRRAGLEGVLCYGPDRDGEPTYVALADWADVGGPMETDAARAELARRYLAAYGPAGPEDLAAWSGLPLSEMRLGFEKIRDDLLEVDVAGAPAWMLKSRAAWLDDVWGDGVAVRLLPSYDPYLLGYRSRELTVPEQYAKRVHPGGGVLHPTLLVDGLAAATWRLKRGKDSFDVTVDPFEALADDVAQAIDEEIRDLERFLNLKRQP